MTTKNLMGLSSGCLTAVDKRHHSTHFAWVFFLFFFSAISHAQVFEACGPNKQIAIVHLEALMVDAEGYREISGHESLNQNQYHEKIVEDASLVTDAPVAIEKIFLKDNLVCVQSREM